MIIYKITNLVNSKMYIGQTSKSIKDRWSKHCSAHSQCPRLKSAIKKYGKDNFKIEEIDRVSCREELNKSEINAIKKYNCIHPNGYNLTSGGRAFCHNNETKAKIGRAHLGSKRSKKVRENISKAAKGRVISEQQKRNIANTLKGRKSLMKGKGKPIRCIDTNTLYSCAFEAANVLGLDARSVNRVASGDRKTTGGYRFRYE